MPVRRSLLAVRIRSTGQPRPSLWQPTKIVASVENQQPDIPEFRRPDGAPLRRDSGATALWN